MDETISKNNLLEVVLNEWDKYEDNSIILTRLINCITNLPEMLENTNTTIIEFKSFFTIINFTIILHRNCFLNTMIKIFLW